MIRRSACAVAAALAFGACNDNPRIGEEEKIANTAETLLRLCADQDGLAVINVLAQDTRRLFIEAGGVLAGCQAVTDLGDAQEIPGPDLFRRAQVVAVSRRGDQGFARLAVGDVETEINLLDTGSQWLVANPPLYTPVDAPPGSAPTRGPR